MPAITWQLILMENISAELQPTLLVSSRKSRYRYQGAKQERNVGRIKVAGGIAHGSVHDCLLAKVRVLTSLHFWLLANNGARHRGDLVVDPVQLKVGYVPVTLYSYPCW